MSDSPQPIILITGAGGMGLAIASRLGLGKKIVLADFSAQNLESAKAALRTKGHADVETIEVDVSSAEFVAKVAEQVSSLDGKLGSVVHTAGLSPIQSTAERIYKVDLVGTANVIDLLLPVIEDGGAMVCIASIAGHVLSPPLSLPDERFLAMAPTHDLLSFPGINLETDTSAKAYAVSKRANILRAKAAAAKGRVRINTISPGTIDTPMLQEELKGVAGDHIRNIIEALPVGKVGTAEDIAEAVEFLIKAGFVTGTDVVVDGGHLAKMGGGMDGEAWE